MIQGPDLHQGQGFFHTLRNALIGLARLSNPARVVMRQDGSGRVMPQGALDHLARMHARPVDGAPEQLLEGKNPMPVVKPQDREDFVLQVADPQL